MQVNYRIGRTGTLDTLDYFELSEEEVLGIFSKNKGTINIVMKGLLVSG